MAYSGDAGGFPQPIDAPAITPNTMGNVHVSFTYLGEPPVDEASIESRIRKMYHGEIPVPQTSFQEYGRVKQQLAACLRKYSATMEWYPGEELAKAYNATLDTLDARNYWQSLYMCDQYRYRYLTQPPRAGRQILLQKGILFWKYSLMRSLILPMIGIEKAMFEAEYQLRGCGGSQILKAIYGNPIPSIMRDWRFVSAVAVEEDWRCNAISMVQGKVEEPSFVAVTPELLEIRRC